MRGTYCELHPNHDVSFTRPRSLIAGLFHGVIVESGPVTAFWAVHSPKLDCNLTVHFTTLVRKLGCWNDRHELVLQCLRNKPVKAILDQHVRYEKREKGSWGHTL